MGRLNLFDSHCHMDDAAYDEDRAEVLAEIAANLAGIVNAGCNGPTCEAALELAHKYPFVYAAVGWHPEEIRSMADTDIERLRTWAQDSKVVAIGEIGLDYYHDEGAPHEVQQKRFVEQLHLAQELELPIMIHDREAHGDCLRLLQEEGQGLVGVFHCYSGSLEMAKELWKMGFYLGFGGSSTFANSKKTKDVLSHAPLDRILFETDSPYLTPMPYRGKRNKPTYTELVVEHAATLRSESKEELIEASTANLKRLYKKIK